MPERVKVRTSTAEVPNSATSYIVLTGTGLTPADALSDLHYDALNLAKPLADGEPEGSEFVVFGVRLVLGEVPVQDRPVPLRGWLAYGTLCAVRGNPPD